MKALISAILAHPDLIAKPPVFVDIGASGGLPNPWRPLAAHSICVAFDADDRDFAVTESSGGDWQTLYSLNRLVTAGTGAEADFYLTRSPHCSSTLPPHNQALQHWAFAPLFEVERQTRLPAVRLPEVLESLGLDRIDWFKTDSQGTDLRIFASLPEALQQRILVADFEPGILDAYQGEDKLHHVLAYMEGRPFWVSNLVLKGSQRIDRADLEAMPAFQRAHLGPFLPPAPGWGEITYLNSFAAPTLGQREYLLGWVFAMLNQQYGFAMRLAREGGQGYGDPLFPAMHRAARRALNAGWPGLIGRLVRRMGRIVGLGN